MGFLRWVGRVGSLGRPAMLSCGLVGFGKLANTIRSLECTARSRGSARGPARRRYSRGKDPAFLGSSLQRSLSYESGQGVIQPIAPLAKWDIPRRFAKLSSVRKPGAIRRRSLQRDPEFGQGLVRGASGFLRIGTSAR
jgi:hypothetical protein